MADIASMAERISAAATSVPEPTPAAEAAPEPVNTPEPATPEPAAAAPAPEPELQFDDDPPELNFDETPAPETPAPEVAPETPKPQDEFEGLLPKQVENAFLKTNRGRHLLSTYKAMRDLRAEPQIDPATGENVGGLGYIPTAQQIREFHRAHSDMQAMETEFVTNPQSFAVNWFAPDGNGQFREGADRVLATLPTMLDSVYENAVQTGNKALEERTVGIYRQMLTPMVMSFADGLYDEAAKAADPAQREQLANAARLLEYKLTGKHRPDDAVTPKPEDPLAERERALAEREARLNAWQAKSATEAQKAVENEIFQTIDSQLTKDCERALESVRAGLSPRAFRAAVNDFRKEVQEAVRKNQLGFRDFNFKLTAARSARGAEARTAPVLAYQQMARQVIQSRWRTVLQELANDAVRQNAATRDTAAQAAAQTAPSVNGGQPPAQSVVAEAKITRMPGEDATDFYERRLRATLGGAS